MIVIEEGSSTEVSYKCKKQTAARSTSGIQSHMVRKNVYTSLVTKTELKKNMKLKA